MEDLTAWSGPEPETSHGAGILGIVSALGLAAALGLMAATENTRFAQAPADAVPAPAGFDPSRFILNALLVPALDDDVPLRWVDPRPAMHCGPGSVVRVNGAPLRPGTLVPNLPFALEWRADGCLPFGAQGPRFDGRVKLTVFREDWGFSAIVEPADLRIELEPGRALYPVRMSATMPQATDTAEPSRAQLVSTVSLP